jgi:hypothetical protein
MAKPCELDGELGSKSGEIFSFKFLVWNRESSTIDKSSASCSSQITEIDLCDPTNLFTENLKLETANFPNPD